ncbi:hypothetical protein CXG81DRAFT_16655 [Caulochytrium protostelioides]|nr:hypothetical protein CXG81DRAFT_16655 [Caulochytrium protostelioides]|eukprot:RKP03820.1 hypothetical protein CXG81DRAFT_16655 [Caulochytrium protostelioides]
MAGPETPSATAPDAAVSFHMQTGDTAAAPEVYSALTATPTAAPTLSPASAPAAVPTAADAAAPAEPKVNRLPGHPTTWLSPTLWRGILHQLPDPALVELRLTDQRFRRLIDRDMAFWMQKASVMYRRPVFRHGHKRALTKSERKRSVQDWQQAYVQAKRDALANSLAEPSDAEHAETTLRSQNGTDIDDRTGDAEADYDRSEVSSVANESVRSFASVQPFDSDVGVAPDRYAHVEDSPWGSTESVRVRKTSTRPKKWEIPPMEFVLDTVRHAESDGGSVSSGRRSKNRLDQAARELSEIEAHRGGAFGSRRSVAEAYGGDYGVDDQARSREMMSAFVESQKLSKAEMREYYKNTRSKVKGKHARHDTREFFDA